MTDATPITPSVPRDQGPLRTHAAFRAARDLLLALRTDPDAARARFRWPDLPEFNWARDWFDHVAADPVTGPRTALWVIDPAAGDDGLQVSYAALAARSRQVAGWLAGLGALRGDRVLVMLDNQVELWETVLACLRLGATVIPAATTLSATELRDRIERGAARFVVADGRDAARFAELRGGWTAIAVGAQAPGWLPYAGSALAAPTSGVAATEGQDTLLLYFTSGTTARPKLVEHTQISYPVGHLSTMYWAGLQPGDVHLTVASPGWAKHAWTSLFAPWNAEATVVALRGRGLVPGGPRRLLETLARCRVTTVCALPTVWRMLARSELESGIELEAWRDRLELRELLAAGERLDVRVARRIEQAWGRPIREGFGQTETTALVGMTPVAPGERVTTGSMGRALPGYEVVLVDPVTGAEALPGPDGGQEGELCVRLAPLDAHGDPLGRPVGLMAGYRHEEGRTAETMHDGRFHTGDLARRDASGLLVHVGRMDEVFRSAEARVSPFELESALAEHPAVAEAAVVPSADAHGGVVVKAFVGLAAGWEPSAQTAGSVLAHARGVHHRIERLEFADLPRTAGGKIRRALLREQEARRRAEEPAGPHPAAPGEFWWPA
jgi:acetyl-CoA synthetase